MLLQAYVEKLADGGEQHFKGFWVSGNGLCFRGEVIKKRLPNLSHCSNRNLDCSARMQSTACGMIGKHRANPFLQAAPGSSKFVRDYQG